ncbi:MAG: undecaprenyldiphospho-muramoylpentapeptide beta-N-acetylglucosaminyltransferase [Deltaproteobacteria bacterium]|nr:undecaprenyldiphospho-muramoylpentapeptide beta-N-acetylglucosaminyltransferase [Deltaproteobacteria bacterium]
MPRAVRMLFAAGGTGGHLFPGVAVAEAARRDVGAEVLFVGTQHGMEKDMIPRLGFALQFIPAEQLRGRNWRGTLHSLWAAFRALGVAWRVVRDFSPDLIFSIGGYASAPTVVVGWLRRIPCVLLEPNAIPGLTNKWLGRLATRVCVGFPQTAAVFPAGKAVCTGNPVRWKLSNAPESTSPAAPLKTQPTLLIFGGSAGARRLNHTMPQALALLGQARGNMRIVHQTGKADHAEVSATYAQLGLPAEVVPFIDNMQEMYLATDLVVCRAGATTIAELTSLGKPAILVPYPYAVDDHQCANAEILVHAGAARMVLDAELTPERMCEEIRALITDPTRLVAMGHAATTVGRPDATAAVVRECVACLPPEMRAQQEVAWQ